MQGRETGVIGISYFGQVLSVGDEKAGDNVASLI